MATADQPSPARLSEGIRFEHVSFAYPGTDRLVLDDITLDLPVRKVIAMVGENGAGKSTLVKLLAKMYAPTRGRILIDSIDLARISAVDWRARLAGAFQDFFRFEFRARQTIGIGDLPRLEDEPAVLTAVSRAGADDVIARLRQGSTRSWPHVARRYRSELWPVAEARSRTWVHARAAIGARAGRTNRGTRRRDRACAVRAICSGGA